MPLRRPFPPRRFFFDSILVERWQLFQIFRLEDLVAVQAPHIVDPIAAHQEFSALVFATRHRSRLSLF